MCEHQVELEREIAEDRKWRAQKEREMIQVASRHSKSGLTNCTYIGKQGLRYHSWGPLLLNIVVGGEVALAVYQARDTVSNKQGVALQII